MAEQASGERRQGDCILIPVKEIPKDATKADGGTIMEGEVTGHCHRVIGDKVQRFVFQSQQFVEVGAPAKLVHDEHKTHPIAPGCYEVVRQREYHPEGWRPVAD